MEEIFSNVEDLSDPVLIDHILMRLEETQSEDEEFMQILLSKQNEMVITWPQPWYQLSKSLTRPFHEINDKEEDTYRTDKICHEEIKKIHKNWRKFRKIYGVPNKPICLARWRNKEKSRSPSTPEEFIRRFVISFLAQNLKRNLHQVYKHFVTYYGSPNKGPYKEYEKNVMTVCVDYSPKNAVPYLSAILSREPRGIYKKICQLYNVQPDKKKIKWTLPLATTFLHLLMEYIGETSIENMKHKQIEKSVWSKLEGDIGQQCVYLQHFWYDTLRTQLFIKSDVKINKLRRKIFKIIRLYPYRVWTDIHWKDIASNFPDIFSARFLYQLCYKVVYNFPEGYRKHSLDDVIIYGIQRSKSMRSKRLKTLILNNDNKLETIRYTNKIKY